MSTTKFSFAKFFFIHNLLMYAQYTYVHNTKILGLTMREKSKNKNSFVMKTFKRSFR